MDALMSPRKVAPLWTRRVPPVCSIAPCDCALLGSLLPYPITREPPPPLIVERSTTPPVMLSVPVLPGLLPVLRPMFTTETKSSPPLMTYVPLPPWLPMFKAALMRKAAAERDDVDRAAGLINGSLATEVPDLQRGPEGDCAA